MIKGQLVIYINNGHWEHAYVEYVYDECYTVRGLCGYTNGLIILDDVKDETVLKNNLSDTFTVFEIKKDGKPIIIPKNIFGKRNLKKFLKKARS